MPTPDSNSIEQSFNKLKNKKALSRQDFFNIISEFVFLPNKDKDHFLLQTNASNPKLAETLIVFRKKLSETARNKTTMESFIDQAFLHYIINTDGQILLREGEDSFDVFDAATRYAKFFNVSVRKLEDGASLLNVDGKEDICPEWGAIPNWSAAWSLRKVGPVINKVRYGRDDVIPSNAFGFEEGANDHTLPNAMTLADFSHLAYFSPEYVGNQLIQWGYDVPLIWVEGPKTDTQAFVTGKDDHLVLCFRGTSSKTDALIDARFLKTEAFGGRGRVHKGFNAALDSVWDQVKDAVNKLGKKKKIFVTGHSLGAGLAQLAAHRLVLNGYTVAAVYVYGSPRVGNRDFREAYNEKLGSKTFLHINNKDAVTKLPPPILGFCHMGSQPLKFDRGHNFSQIADMEDEKEAEMDFEELSAEKQEEIEEQLEEAKKSMKASTRFLTTKVRFLETGSYSTSFEEGLIDDHSMDQYLFKLGCAIVDGEWKRIGEKR